VRRGDRTRMPGADRASSGINTTEADISRLITAVTRIAADRQGPVAYVQDPRTGDFVPDRDTAQWYADGRSRGSSCSTG